MGYPIRWDQLSVPEAPALEVARETQQPGSLRKYYLKLAAVTLAGSLLLTALFVGIHSLLLADWQAPLRLDSMPAGSALAPSQPVAARRLGFVIVSGRLANRSTRSLDNVEAVVDLMDADQHTLRTESAMISQARFLPGQASDYRVAMPDESRATAFRLRFKRLYGAQIE